MGDFNQVILCGRLGRDAELRYTQGGAAVATLNLATTEVWNDKQGQKQERTEWSRVILWGKQAESLQEFLTKGKQLLVVGSVQTRKWTDKDGQDRWTTEIKAHRVVLLGGNGRRPEPEDAGDEPGHERGSHLSGDPVDDLPSGPSPGGITDDDIPFAVWLPLLLPLLGAICA